ncbi:PQ-loop-domain-containing protein [Tothia fuscella]|uniref:PQ-loop-domain-containing protein n=1 Tax=Tothia fuscella TaxID=1048955 RepID=A0A9P4NS68_9PEZI|nr:PQ-loop-domain-containing protein [Tothia fuscella]
MAEAVHAHLAVHEALSGVFGSISLASWVFLLVPQLIENYKQGSAEGISLTFLCVWFIGDLTNLSGALLLRLVPTVIALAVYFCIADLILISQCLYYNTINARRMRKISQMSTATEDSAEQPLLRRDTNENSRRRSSLGLPGSHRRSSVSRRDSLTPILEESSGNAAWLKNGMAVMLVCLAGTIGWVMAWKSGVWHPTPEHAGPIGDRDMQLGGQVLGYISAVAYLGARIPQIVKNQRERSCEGLSLLFFLLSLLGNFTYGAGILFHSLERDYVLTNLPWLIGSLGTMAEDAVIFIQFRMFRDGAADVAVE